MHYEETEVRTNQALLKGLWAENFYKRRNAVREQISTLEAIDCWEVFEKPVKPKAMCPEFVSRKTEMIR